MLTASAYSIQITMKALSMTANFIFYFSVQRVRHSNEQFSNETIINSMRSYKKLRTPHINNKPFPVTLLRFFFIFSTLSLSVDLKKLQYSPYDIFDVGSLEGLKCFWLSNSQSSKICLKMQIQKMSKEQKKMLMDTLLNWNCATQQLNSFEMNHFVAFIRIPHEQHTGIKFVAESNFQTGWVFVEVHCENRNEISQLKISERVSEKKNLTSSDRCSSMHHFM